MAEDADRARAHQCKGSRADGSRAEVYEARSGYLRRPGFASRLCASLGWHGARFGRLSCIALSRSRDKLARVFESARAMERSFRESGLRRRGRQTRMAALRLSAKSKQSLQ